MNQPWYKQFWPWFLMALPLTAVIGSFITLGIFTQNKVSLVSEDYYKDGKGINVDLSKINAAKALDLHMSLQSTSKGVQFKFDKRQLATYPALTITFSHRTLAHRDFFRTLTADAQGYYRLNLDEAIQGPWFVKVQPHDQTWLVQGRVTFPSAHPIYLTE